MQDTKLPAMAQQLSLMDWKPPYRDGQDTSKKASKKVSSLAGTLRVKCLEYIREQGENGATADEATEYLEGDINSIRPRFSELKNAGLIYDNGLRRPNKKGNKQRVYAITTN